MVWFAAISSATATITINPWVPIFKGIEFTTGEADTNEVRQQKIRALRVDLTEPTIEFFSTPSNGAGPMETDGQTTTTFVDAYGVAVGVNANFFSPVTTIPNDPRDLSGLAISQGMLVSPAESGRPMALITRSNVVTLTTSAPANPTNFWTAVAGSDLILINGVPQLTNCTTSFCNENPRTAVGVSSNGHYFYLMVIDGRQPGWSDGATLVETGEWLLRLGAWRGLNLDGGGSTAMAKLENGAAVLLNRPSGGVQRVNGNHLGAFALPLAPVILTQPQDQTVPIGQNVMFTVVAGGTTPLAYQWQFTNSPITGATGTSLSLTNVQTGDRGLYTVAITNSAGATLSSNANLVVTLPMEITNLVVMPRPSSAIIQWTSTPATISQLEYGIAPDYGAASPLEATEQTNHSVLLVGLVPNTNYGFRIHSHVGTSEIVSGQYFFSTDVTVVVDNPQASYSGDWTLGTSSPDKYGAYYQFAPTTADSSPTTLATYTPIIATPGKYDVAIWYPQGANRTTNAQVSIFFNGGIINASVNQQAGGGAWRLLAPAVDCDAGTQSFAVIGNNTGESAGVVMADAMRWSYVTSQDIPTDGSVPGWWSGYYFGGDATASLDPDGDGYSTVAEYVAGTDPINAASRLTMAVQPAPNGLLAVFSPWQGGRVYELQSSTNAASGIWNVLSLTPTVTNGQGFFSVTNSGQAGSRFYRLAVQLMP